VTEQTTASGLVERGSTTAPGLGQLQLLDLSKVEISKLNPRTDVGDLTELAASIGQLGVLEPIVVVQKNGHYEAVAGSRRTAAARKAGLKQIPARIMSLDEAQQAAAALIENLQRKDLTPLEEAHAFEQYIALTGCTQKDLGTKIGRAPSTIANALRLLKAPKEVQAALRDGRLGAAHVRALLQLKDDSLLKRINLEARRLSGRGKDTITVDDIAYRVQELNEDWQRRGTPAIEAAKKELAQATQNLKGFTITWQKDQWDEKLDLVKALGAPPVKVVGEIHQGSTKQHDKVCACRAFEIEQEFYGEPFRVQRVCTDAAGFKKFAGYTPAIRSSSRHDPYARPTTKAGKAAYVAKRVEGHLSVKTGGSWGRRRPVDAVHRKLIAGGWDADSVARLLAYALTVDRCVNVGAEQLALWNRIQKMPAKKLQALVLEHASAIVNGEVLDTKDGGARLAARVTVMRGFGIPVGPKLAEQADEFVRKMAPAPKAKKKAKR